jgi:hypothetical protein
VWPCANRNRRDSYQLVDDGRLLGPVRNWVGITGEARNLLHAALAARLAAVVASPVSPTLSCYLYYEPDDFVELHQDRARCTSEVLVWLSGEPAPLCLHPELANVRPGTLIHHARAGIAHRATTAAAQIRDGPLVMSGTAVPHHRLPHPGQGKLTIAVFCYAASTSDSSPAPQHARDG